MNVPQKPKCYTDNGYGWCIGLISNNYYYHKCIECPLFEVTLCENCTHAIFRGHALGYHLGCELSKSHSWIPHTKALLKKERYNVCPNYKRRMIDENE